MARTSRFLAPLMVLALLLSSVALLLPAQQVLAADYWSINIPADAGTDGSNAALTFGTASGASDAYDAGTDVSAPPAAPGADFDSYFQISSGAFTELNEDYRAALGAAPGSSIVWSLYLMSDSQNIDLSWDDPATAGVPLDASIILSGAGQTINMRSSSAASYTGGDDFTLTITVTRLGPPDEVWVDDDWCEASATEGEIVGDGYVFGYNAFCDIAYGLEAVGDSTVHVFAGQYSAFNITDDDITVMAEEAGAVVDTFDDPWGYRQSAMALVGENRWGSDSADNAVIDGLEFNACALYSGCDFDNGAAAIRYYQSTGSVIGCTIDCVKFDSRSQQGFGVIVGYSESNTVTISDTDIAGCNVGIYVKDDTVVVEDCVIQGGGDYSSYCATGIFVDWDADVTVSGTEIYDCYDIQYTDSPEPDEAPLDGNDYTGAGIFVEDDGSVECSGCCNIHDNEYGIFVQSGGDLTANGNNIEDNDEYGVYYDSNFAPEPGSVNGGFDCEENWWGDEEGPTLPLLTGDEPELTPPAHIKGDWVTYGIDFTPWLDGPCPGGDPVGIGAKFKPSSRTAKAGDEVDFTDISTPPPGCDITSWEWDFDGDGDTDSTEQNPSFTFRRAGTYTVTLCVFADCGDGFSDCYSMSVTIREVDKDEAEPAKMSVSYLLIDPLQVLPGQEVLVSGNVCNQGEERGSKTVSLMVNGVAEQSQTVGVSGGSCQQVSFRLSRAVPGTYQVAIDGMTGQFSVLAPKTVTNNVPSQQDTGLGTAGIIAIIAILIALVAALIFLFRR